MLVVACCKPETSPATPIEAVSIAPQTTGSPNEPTLLLGMPTPPEAGGVERVRVLDGEPDSAWKPPKDRCPDGITELMSVHVPLGQTMILPPGASPVVASSNHPAAADVTFDHGKKIVQVVARQYGLVYVTVERAKKCTLYGVSTGY